MKFYMSWWWCQGCEMHTLYNWGRCIPNSIIFAKNWKTYNPNDVNKIRYDYIMNLRRVVILNAFGSFKTEWCILKHYGISLRSLGLDMFFLARHSSWELMELWELLLIDLHNWCIDRGALKLGHPNLKLPLHKLQGFGDKLPTMK